MTLTTPLPVAAGRVLGHFTVSLDGFVTGPEMSMDWLDGIAFDPAIVERSVETVGAVIGGRLGYDWLVRTDNAGPFGSLWSGPVFILTHHPEDAATRDGYTVLDCSLADAVSTALEAAGGKNVEVHSPTLVRQALEQDLLDDLYLHVAPILIGDGVRLFDRPGGPPVRLRVVAASPGVESGSRTLDVHLQPVA